MRVSTQFPLAFHTLLYIAYFPEIKVTSEMIAESAGCNAVIIRNLFANLKKAGLLSVKAGRGETTLAKLPEEITLWDIYAAIETDSAEGVFKVHPNISFSCPIGRNLHQLLLNHLGDAVDAMRVELSKVTLQSVIDEINMKQDKTSTTPEDLSEFTLT